MFRMSSKKESVVLLFLWFSKKKMHLHSTVQPLENSKDRWVRNIKLILVDDPGAQREKVWSTKEKKGKLKACVVLFLIQCLSSWSIIFFRDSWIRFLNDFNFEHALNKLIVTLVKLRYHFMSLHFTAKPCQDCYNANIWKQKTSSAFVVRTNTTTL